MKQNQRITAILLLLFFSCAVLAIAQRKYSTLEREQCFDRLKEYTEQIGNEIRENFTRDKTYLEKAADTFAGHDLTDLELMAQLLEMLDSNGMLSDIQLLFPDNQLLAKNGKTTDVSGLVSFHDEAEKGIFLSQRMQNPLNPEEMILRIQIPVVQNGKTAALLLGIMNPEYFSELFTVQGYGDAMQLYIVEGISGNFLLNTWHGTLTETAALRNRQSKEGYTKEQIHNDFAKGNAGTTIFLSSKANEYFYTYYTPVGVNDWMVMATVAESVVFAHAKEIQDFQIKISVILFLIFATYVLWLLYDVKREKNVNERQFRKVSYLLDVEKELFSAFIEPHHFQKGLEYIADYATAENAFFWVFSQNYPGKRLWTGNDSVLIKDTDLTMVFPGIFKRLRENGSLLAYDLEPYRKQFPDEADILSRFHIRNFMLILVKKLNGNSAGILGVYNMKHPWPNAELLEQVSLTFSMTLDYYEAYQNLLRMGRIDSLTGLLNRNCYHIALEHLAEEDCGSVACVYMDANGLHELNNYLGHQAGDAMLKAVADELNSSFPEDECFRIGGDEFVVLCQNRTEDEVCQKAEEAQQNLREKGYEISFGVKWSKHFQNINSIVNEAEASMQRQKQEYYKTHGGERQKRDLNRKLEQLLSRKRDMDIVLSSLAPRFNGFYFVNLKEDSLRYLFIPDYFDRMMKASGQKFSKAMLLYVREMVKDEYASLFETVCDYTQLEPKLNQHFSPEFVYQKKDGTWVRLRITVFQSDEEQQGETLWIFTPLKNQL